MMYRANTYANFGNPPSRVPSPRAVRPDFREGSILEERDKSGRPGSKYRIGRLLGRGGFAKCYEGTDLELNASFAIKVIDRAELAKAKMQSKLQSEIAIHRRMSHPNIVRFYKTFQDEWYVYIVLEKCTNQTLMEISRTRPRFSKEEAQFIMLQSLSAISYMHSEGVIHRDLKLGNMMMDSEMNVKIGDFGLAAELQFDGERKRTICGTPNYIAPEILEGAREGHSFEVDMWSLGVILFTLLVGEPPFQTSDVKTTYSRIKSCRYAFPPHIPVSESGKDLVHRILQSRPERRPSLVEVRQHPFLSDTPRVAPLTLFSESQRRRMEQGRTATPRMEQQKAPLQPLNPNYNNNYGQQPTSAKPSSSSKPNTPRETGLRAPAPDSARGPATAHGNGNGNGGVTAGGLGRINSMPGRPVPSVNGWTGKPDSRPPSPRDAAAAPTRQAPAPSTTTATTARRNTAPPADDDEDKHHLTAVHDKLHRTFHGGQQADDDGEALTPPPVWVTDYADFSAKYGLAYRLNTGHTAVHYNDSTKMVWEPVTNRVEYYARVKETVNGVVHAVDQRQGFHMDTFPEDLNKKVTLIKYFKSYLAKGKGKKEVEVVTCSPYTMPAPVLLTEPNMVSDMVYVKRWLITPQAMIFRLSNKCIQVCFFDRAEVILSSETKVVTYTDAGGKRITIPLSKAAAQSDDVANRLKNTKDILCTLINNREL